LREQRFERVPFRDFRRNEASLAAGLANLRETGIRFFFAAAGDHDFGAGSGEREGHGTAEFARSADDDGDFVVQPEEFLRDVLHGKKVGLARSQHV